MEWIRHRVEFHSDTRVISIQNHLQTSNNTVCGALFKLWCWGHKHADLHGRVSHVSFDDLDKIAELPGLCRAMQRVGWLAEADGGIVFTEWHKHNGFLQLQREKNKQKCRKYRDGKKEKSSLPDEPEEDDEEDDDTGTTRVRHGYDTETTGYDTVPTGHDTGRNGVVSEKRLENQGLAANDTGTTPVGDTLEERRREENTPLTPLSGGKKVGEEKPSEEEEEPAPAQPGVHVPLDAGFLTGTAKRVRKAYLELVSPSQPSQGVEEITTLLTHGWTREQLIRAAEVYAELCRQQNRPNDKRQAVRNFFSLQGDWWAMLELDAKNRKQPTPKQRPVANVRQARTAG